MDSSFDPPRVFCGLKRPALKYCAVVASVGALALFAVGISRSICGTTDCELGTTLGFLVMALIATALCSGLCVVTPSNQQQTCCGCNREEHDFLWISGFFLGFAFFFLSLFATKSWIAAMLICTLFFCVVGCVGIAGCVGIGPPARFPTVPTVTSSVPEECL